MITSWTVSSPTDPEFYRRLHKGWGEKKKGEGEENVPLFLSHLTPLELDHDGTDLMVLLCTCTDLKRYRQFSLSAFRDQRVHRAVPSTDKPITPTVRLGEKSSESKILGTYL